MASRISDLTYVDTPNLSLNRSLEIGGAGTASGRTTLMDVLNKMVLTQNTPNNIIIGGVETTPEFFIKPAFGGYVVDYNGPLPSPITVKIDGRYMAQSTSTSYNDLWIPTAAGQLSSFKAEKTIWFKNRHASLAASFNVVLHAPADDTSTVLAATNQSFTIYVPANSMKMVTLSLWRNSTAIPLYKSFASYMVKTSESDSLQSPFVTDGTPFISYDDVRAYLLDWESGGEIGITPTPTGETE